MLINHNSLLLLYNPLHPSYLQPTVKYSNITVTFFHTSPLLLPLVEYLSLHLRHLEQRHAVHGTDPLKKDNACQCDNRYSLLFLTNNTLDPNFHVFFTFTLLILHLHQ